MSNTIQTAEGIVKMLDPVPAATMFTGDPVKAGDRCDNPGSEAIPVTIDDQLAGFISMYKDGGEKTRFYRAQPLARPGEHIVQVIDGNDIGHSWAPSYDLAETAESLAASFVYAEQKREAGAAYRERVRAIFAHVPGDWNSDEWNLKECTGHWGGVMERETDGLSIRVVLQDGRFTASYVAPETRATLWTNHYDQKIGFTAKKTPEQAGKDITRRLLPHAEEAHGQILAIIEGYEEKQAKATALRLRVAAIMRDDEDSILDRSDNMRNTFGRSPSGGAALTCKISETCGGEPTLTVTVTKMFDNTEDMAAFVEKVKTLNLFEEK